MGGRLRRDHVDRSCSGAVLHADDGDRRDRCRFGDTLAAVGQPDHLFRDLRDRQLDSAAGRFGPGRKRVGRIFRGFHRGRRAEFEHFQRAKCDG